MTTAADAIRLATILDRVSELAAAIGEPLECEVGKRFIRLVASPYPPSRHVHAFVEIETGNLLKAAGWKAPAKGARGNLLDDADFARILSVADKYGSYLYINK
jgi:hypothetical protein